MSDISARADRPESVIDSDASLQAGSLEVGPLELGGGLSLRFQTMLRLPRICDVAFDGSLVGKGWHDCEKAPDARPYRWMGGSETATVVVAVDRTCDLAATFQIFMWRDDSFRDAVYISVDDPPHLVACQINCESLSFILPRCQHHEEVTRIKITTKPGLMIPPDPRSLSVAFSSLHIRPLHDLETEETRLALNAKLSQYIRALEDLAPIQRAASAWGLSSSV